MIFDNTSITFDTSELRKGRFSRVEIEKMVRFHCGNLQIPPGEDAFSILMAICGVESSFGKNDKPRFEAYYSENSVAFKKDKLLQSIVELHGDWGACSYGPFQILFYNACLLGFPVEKSPANLWNPVVSLPYVVEYINRGYKYGAKTVLDLFAQYNGGWGVLTKEKLYPKEYVNKAILIYQQLKQIQKTS